MSTYLTTTVGPTRQSLLEPRPRIDTTWIVTRSGDGSIAIVREWHFRSGDGNDAQHPEQRAIERGQLQARVASPQHGDLVTEHDVRRPRSRRLGQAAPATSGLQQASVSKP
jgi:hypothetical protein